MFRVLVAACCAALATAAAACGERVTLPGHDGNTFLASVAAPSAAWGGVVLLAGGGGVLDLGADGCARALTGNTLVRLTPRLQAAGLATALLDAPGDHRGEDGLAGFRADPRHAADIGRAVLMLRGRVAGPVWVIGNSRGTISAANAAARLDGAARPDGLVVASVLTSGNAAGRKAWVAQTVFDLPLEAIRVPALLIAHGDDACIRTPPALAAKVAERIASERKQVVLLGGGPGGRGATGVEACEGRSPHGFVGQDDELLAGIVRFMRGGRF